MDIPKAIGHDGAQPRSSAPALDAKDQNNNLVRFKAQVDDFRVDGPADSSEVANVGKNARTIIQKRAPSSHSFVFEDSFFIRSNSALVKLKFEHIIYLEADANYTQLVTNEKKYIIRASLKDLEKKLDDKRFARVHKSFLVNLEKIISIQAESMQIADKEIPIGRQQYRWLTSQIRIL